MQVGVEGEGVGIWFTDRPAYSIIIFEPQVRFFSPQWTPVQLSPGIQGDWGFREHDMGDVENIVKYGAVWFGKVCEA